MTLKIKEMRRVVKYISIDPFYCDKTQTYIGYDGDEIDSIQYETEKYMGQYHPNGINNIYKSEVVYDETDGLLNEVMKQYG